MRERPEFMYVCLQGVIDIIPQTNIMYPVHDSRPPVVKFFVGFFLCFFDSVHDSVHRGLESCTGFMIFVCGTMSLHPVCVSF